MPHVVLATNIKVPDEKAVVKKLSELSSKLLGKPEAVFLVQYRCDPSLLFAGTFEPAFMLQVNALGGINAELNEGYCEGFTKFMVDELGIPAGRGYIVFTDPGRENWGVNGKTLAVK